MGKLTDKWKSLSKIKKAAIIGVGSFIIIANHGGSHQQNANLNPQKPNQASTLNISPAPSKQTLSQQPTTPAPSPVINTPTENSQPTNTSQNSNSSPDQQPTCTDDSYVNSEGDTVCSPETAPSAPAGATAQCADGTYSFSENHRGTCSHHGGVSSWL